MSRRASTPPPPPSSAPPALPAAMAIEMGLDFADDPPPPPPYPWSSGSSGTTSPMSTSSRPESRGAISPIVFATVSSSPSSAGLASSSSPSTGSAGKPIVAVMHAAPQFRLPPVGSAHAGATGSLKPAAFHLRIGRHAREESIPPPPPSHAPPASPLAARAVTAAPGSSGVDLAITPPSLPSTPPPPPSVVRVLPEAHGSAAATSAAGAAIPAPKAVPPAPNRPPPSLAGDRVSPPPPAAAGSSSVTATGPPPRSSNVSPTASSSFTAIRSRSCTITPPTTDASAPASVASSSPPAFDLNASLALIQSDTALVAETLEAQETSLLQTRSSMISLSRRNFMLERELHEIDEKIKLLLRNRLTVQEVISSSSSSSSSSHPATDDHAALVLLKNRKALYEELFFLLQSRPRYFALLARLIQPSKDGLAMFVQTVVLDTYGDAFDTHEERLLLSLFRSALQAEMQACNDRATLLRANTAITQMLSAYAKRGQGLGILREILEEPLRQLCDSKPPAAAASTDGAPTASSGPINFELQPLKILHQLIQEHEVATGQISRLPKECATDAEALEHPEVVALLNARVLLLQAHVGRILARILASAQRIPYGMRWICRILGELYRQRFGPEEAAAKAAAAAAAAAAAGKSSATNSSSQDSTASTGSTPPPPEAKSLAAQIRAIAQGGFLYLRFFNPVIVAPESINFISTKPSRVMRRNLVLIAKVLQNLSNGQLFGEKEPYMRVLNPWLRLQMRPMEVFFEELIAVEEDVDEELTLDKYTYSSVGTFGASSASSSSSPSSSGRGASSKLQQLTLSLNQIFLTQSLLVQFKEKICLGPGGTYCASDPLALLLNKFGPIAPAQVPRAENVNVTLRLVDTRDSRLSTIAMNGTLGGGGGASHAVTVDPFRGTLHRQSMFGGGPGGGGTYGGGSGGMDPTLHPLYLQAKNLLLNVLKRLPPGGSTTGQRTLLGFLNEQRHHALTEGNHGLHDSLSNISAMLNTLYNMNLLPSASSSTSAAPSSASDERDRAIDAFLQACTAEALARRSSLGRLEKQRAKITLALGTVTNHHEYLKSRLELYQLYLQNVKAGQAQQEERNKKTAAGGGHLGGSSSGDKKSSAFSAFSSGSSSSDQSSSSGSSSSASDRTMKFKHEQLVSMHLLHSISGDLSPTVLKHLRYVLEMKTETSRHLAPRFYLSAHLKKGALSISVLEKKVEIVLGDLLRMQEHGEPYLTVEAVRLNVTPLLALIQGLLGHAPPPPPPRVPDIPAPSATPMDTSTSSTAPRAKRPAADAFTQHTQALLPTDHPAHIHTLEDEPRYPCR